MSGYPIVLTRCERAIVVGGGDVALRKVEGLLAGGAAVVVISNEAIASLRAQAEEGRFSLILRQFQPGDLAGAQLAVAATDDRNVNEMVYREARKLGILVNVVDDPQRCTFHVPAVVQRGPVTVAVSTGGASPHLAAYLRKRIAKAVGDEYGTLAEILGDWRAWILHNVPKARRAALWDELITRMLPLLRAGNAEEATRVGAAIVSRAAGRPTPQDWLPPTEASCAS
jgi:precorrin-2 dehydrogenase/sirohydrochlorin ferrochelatase